MIFPILSKVLRVKINILHKDEKDGTYYLENENHIITPEKEGELNQEIFLIKTKDHYDTLVERKRKAIDEIDQSKIKYNVKDFSVTIKDIGTDLEIKKKKETEDRVRRSQGIESKSEKAREMEGTENLISSLDQKQQHQSVENNEDIQFQVDKMSTEKRERKH